MVEGFSDPGERLKFHQTSIFNFVLTIPNIGILFVTMLDLGIYFFSVHHRRGGGGE